MSTERNSHPRGPQLPPSPQTLEGLGGTHFTEVDGGRGAQTKFKDGEHDTATDVEEDALRLDALVNSSESVEVLKGDEDLGSVEVGLSRGETSAKVAGEEEAVEGAAGAEVDEKMEDRKLFFTVDEALISLGFGNFQFLVLVYAGMGWIAEAMEMMLLSFVGPAVQIKWNLSSHEESLISSAVFAGMLVGAYTWGIVSDNYGRRKGFFITAVLTGVAGLISAASPNYIALILARCLVGIGLGGGPVLSSWFLEFIPSPTRGTWMVVLSAFWTLGTILEASLAWIIMPRLGWRWLLALSSLPTLMLLLFYTVVPESPRYLCMKGRKSDALRVLETVAKLNKSRLPHGTLISDDERKHGERSIPLEEFDLLSLEEDATNADEHRAIPIKKTAFRMRAFSSLIMLLSPKLIKSTILLWVVFFGNVFSYYGLVLLTSKLSNTNGDCSKNASHSENGKNVNLYKDVFLTSLAEVPGLILSAAMVDRVGRKLSMSLMFFLCCIFLLPLAFHQSEHLTTALLICARICITGTFTIVFIYAPEIYPTSVRTTGFGVASSVGRIGGIICPLVAVGLMHGCHRIVAIIVFELVVFFSGIAVVLFPLETSGKALKDTVSSM